MRKYNGADKDEPVTKRTFFDLLKEALADYPTKPDMLEALSDKATRGFVLETIANYPTPEIIDGRYVSKDYLLEDYTKVISEVMDMKIEKRIIQAEERWEKRTKENQEFLAELKEMNKDSKIRISLLEKHVFERASA